MNVCDEPRVKVKDEKLFFKIVKASFAQRRKTLLNCLSNGFSKDKGLIEQILKSVRIDPGIRGERLGIEEFAKISDKFFENQIK